jgi:hypothetical protein
LEHKIRFIEQGHADSPQLLKVFRNLPITSTSKSHKKNPRGNHSPGIVIILVVCLLTYDRRDEAVMLVVSGHSIVSSTTE